MRMELHAVARDLQNIGEPMEAQMTPRMQHCYILESQASYRLFRALQDAMEPVITKLDTLSSYLEQFQVRAGAADI